MRALDTSEKAAAIQEKLYAAAGPEGRFCVAMRLSELAREFAKAGVRNRNPDFSDEEVMREIARMFYGFRRRVSTSVSPVSSKPWNDPESRMVTMK